MSNSAALNPLVSVITPAYNVAPFVGQAIESVLAQTMADFEMIVVDDGSGDGTSDVVRTFAERDTRIVLVQSANRGVSTARNTAMPRARGRYFAFLDADDIWDRMFLAHTLAILGDHPGFSIVTANARNLGGTCSGEAVRQWPPTRQELTMRDIVEHEDAVFIMSVFRREVFDTIGGFDPARSKSEDYHFWLRAVRAGFRCIAEPLPLGLYRRRTGSASTDEIGMLSGIIDVLEEFQGTCADPETSLAIMRQLDRFRRRRSVCRATSHLLCRDYRAAAHDLDALQELGGRDLRLTCARLLARACPSVLAAAYKARLSWLHRRAKAESVDRRARARTLQIS